MPSTATTIAAYSLPELWPGMNDQGRIDSAIACSHGTRTTRTTATYANRVSVSHLRMRTVRSYENTICVAMHTAPKATT